MPDVEVVGMVYKSIAYVDLLCDQLAEMASDKVAVRVVANDASEEVLHHLEMCHNHVPLTIYEDAASKDYYLNRVYRAWNHAVETSACESVCLVNSDMVFSSGWLEALLKHHDGAKIPCSRLVESGKMRSGKHGFSKDFGRSPGVIAFDEWCTWAKGFAEDRVEPGGLYMPCIWDREQFMASGGYPEGNIYAGGAGAHTTKFRMSGDKYFFGRMARDHKLKHFTVFDSVVYHIQEGEMDA